MSLGFLDKSANTPHTCNRMSRGPVSSSARIASSPSLCGSRASLRRFPTTLFQRQSRTPTMSGSTFSALEDDGMASRAASLRFLCLDRVTGLRRATYRSISLMSVATPSDRRNLSWFSGWRSQSLDRIWTASVRMLLPACLSPKRFNMISTPSSAPSSFCRPGRPTTEINNINAPLTNPSALLDDCFVAFVSVEWLSSTSPEHASRNRNARMCPFSFWKAWGARGARFNKTAMACCCRTCSFVSSKLLRMPGIRRPLSVSLETTSYSSSSEGSSSTASNASTSKYINKQPMKSASTTNCKFSSSARPRSLSTDQRMRRVSRSSVDAVAKVCRSANGGSIELRGSRFMVARVLSSMASSGNSAAQAYSSNKWMRRWRRKAPWDLRWDAINDATIKTSFLNRLSSVL